MPGSAENLPVLYSFRRCPYAIRARLALRYAGVQCELREVVLRNKPEAMLAASPKGTVPVLVPATANAPAESIDESLDIMLWALEQSDPEGWLNVDHVAVNQLIEANDEQFKPWLDRYKYPDRYADLAPDEARGHCEFFLHALESLLTEQKYLSGKKVGLADMAIYSFVRQFAFVDIDWFRASPYRGVNQWLQEFLSSELFEAVMLKYPPWQPGDDPQFF